jgi:hypothetical protein
MNVDEPGRHALSARIDLGGAALLDSRGHSGDPAAAHRDVVRGTWRSTAVENEATTDDQVVRGPPAVDRGRAGG